MKYLIILFAMVMAVTTKAQKLDLKKIETYESSLDDVMEIIGNDLVIAKLKEVEKEYKNNPNELNTIRLGLIYHETALNLTFFDKTKKYAGYAQKSYDILTKMSEDDKTTPELMIYIDSYRASALSLMAGETRKLSLLGTAFKLFKETIESYSSLSPRPEFMRGSVAENLPSFMWRKTKFAKIDFDSIIKKQEINPSYADFRIMSFSYWAWARAYSSKKHRKQALSYLDKAIKLDSDYKAGRKRAEELKAKYERD